MFKKRIIIIIIIFLLIFLGFVAFKLIDRENDSTKEIQSNPTDTDKKIVTDTIAPTIILIGDKEITIEVGSKFIDLGATASDNKDGDITKKIVIKSDVDINKVGEYSLTYNVSDTAGNMARVFRTVKVINKINTKVSTKKNVPVVVTNIDKIAPTATVSYSTITLTKYNVRATIIPSEEVTITNNGGSLEYLFTDNGTFTFNFVDRGGNVGSVTATVANIDKTAPTATVSYTTIEPTNGNVTATIIPSEEVTVTNNSGSLEYLFIENGTFTFDFVDNAGNSGTVTATVANIDKTVPTATVSYSTRKQTKNDVVVSLTTSEVVRNISRWTKVKLNSNVWVKTYTSNIQETVLFQDLVGNNGTATISINNIDKEAPVLTITGYDPIYICGFYRPNNHDLNHILSSGIAARDNVDGDITDDITYDSNVNVYIPFIYQVTYHATDSAGNIGSITRDVVVCY